MEDKIQDNDGDDGGSHGVYQLEENKTSDQFDVTQTLAFEKNYVLRDLLDLYKVSKYQPN